MVTALAAAVAAPWVAWAVVRVFGLEAGHPLVGAMALTPHAAATSALPIGVALLLRRPAVAAVSAAAALALAVAVIPRGLPGEGLAPAGAPGPRLIVMTANLRLGKGDARTILRLADEHRVDVLSLQELTPEAMARLDAAGAGARFEGRAVEPRPGAGGSGLLARRPLRPVADGEPAGRSAQPEAVLTVPGAAALRIKAVHPRPPISRQHVADWQAMLRDLPGPRAGGDGRILAGDFNSTLDHAEMRRLLDRGYRDAADATGDGLTGTWRLARGRPELVIDHVLVPQDVRVRRVSVHLVPGSDHRAVIAELVLPAG